MHGSVEYYLFSSNLYEAPFLFRLFPFLYSVQRTRNTFCFRNAFPAPAAVACDIFLVRRSTHPRGALLYIRKDHFPNI